MIHGCLKKGKSLSGYIKTGLIDLHQLGRRHKELVKEMEIRGFKHNSPLILAVPLPQLGDRINSQKNMEELIGRCHKCAEKTALWFIEGLKDSL
jgi:hypothetical protein